MAYTFKDIKVWQRAHDLVLEVYKITRNFPSDEKYGLVSQLRRSVASIPTNIVEGYKKRSDKEFSYFLNISETSLEETKYHLFLACDLKYISKECFDNLSDVADEVGRMLTGFQKRLKQ
jgi:four helix bundle protein